MHMCVYVHMCTRKAHLLSEPTAPENELLFATVETFLTRCSLVSLSKSPGAATIR